MPFERTVCKQSAQPILRSTSLCVLQALAACAAMRPPVDISVGGDNSSEGVGVGGARTEYRSAVAA